MLIGVDIVKEIISQAQRRLNEFKKNNIVLEVGDV